jgi:hypothetical protein
MIKTACAEFQKQGKVRFQFLCIVMDSSYTEPDEPLKKFPDGDEDIHKIIERDGEVFLAPIAVRSPGAHSSRERDFRLDNTKICHPITTRLADEFQYIFNIAIMSWRWQTCMASSKKDCDQVDIEEDEPRCSSIHLHHGTSATSSF